MKRSGYVARRILLKSLIRLKTAFKAKNAWNGRSSGLLCNAAGCTNHSYIRVGKNPAAGMCSVLTALESSCSFLLYFRMLDFPRTFSMPFLPSYKHHSFFNSEGKGWLFLFWILGIGMYGEVREVHNQFTSNSSDTRLQVLFRTCCLYTSPQGLVSPPVAPCMAILRILIALSYSFVVSKLLFT